LSMIKYNPDMAGNVHSIETGGMADGPGIRYVVFFSGCPLRCKYCHNPDTWDLGAGGQMTVGAIISDAQKYESYRRFSGGGLTISGGEPLMQSAFALELLRAARAHNIHTALDTSGFGASEHLDDILDNTDLLILDIKSINPNVFQKLTGAKIDKTLQMLDLARKKNKATWIRHVLVPGYTDNPDDIHAMANHLRDYPNIEKIQILPFHKLGEHKWESLGFDYELYDTQPPTQESIDFARNILAVQK
ncbi:MAG: pyruvate formate-lyase-activating protein, partial [Defluviitaleaceae bacterium]|nr:pyruvate formate-lyase-activating protein [Defluviitaleaceae bacterium]